MFFKLLLQKMLKMKISTSVLGAQHPKAGQNTLTYQILLIKEATRPLGQAERVTLNVT